MKDPLFLKSFLDKGRMETILKDMPVKLWRMMTPA